MANKAVQGDQEETALPGNLLQRVRSLEKQRQQHPTVSSQPRPALSRLSSTSSTASRGRSNPRRQQPVSYIGASAREVLFGHYIKMAQENRVQLQPGYERPSFLARVFLLLCIPTDLLDFRACVKLGQWLVVKAARAVVLLGFLLVPMWLLALWVLAAGTCWRDLVAGAANTQKLLEAGRGLLQLVAARDWQQLVALGAWRLDRALPDLSTPQQWLSLVKHVGPAAIGGLMFFLVCDAIDAAVARRDMDRRRGVIKPMQLAPMQQPTLASSMHTAPKPLPVPHLPSVHHATASSGSRASARPAAPGLGSEAKPMMRKRTDNLLVKEVRSAVIKLEHQVLGNEVSAAMLPQEVLPARVAKLCEEVGLQCSAHPSFEEMAQLVKSVAEQVGVLL